MYMSVQCFHIAYYDCKPHVYLGSGSITHIIDTQRIREF